METKTKQWSVGSGSATIQYDGQGDGQIIITSDPNSLYEARSMQIAVETTDGSGITRVVTINQAAKVRIDISNAVVTAANQTYSGGAKTPVPTVTLNGSTVPSTGYDVSYSDNTNAGTATITITGKGDYTGTASGTFTIAKASRTLNFADTYMVLNTSSTGTKTATPSAGSGDGAVTYSIANTTYATIDSSTGAVTAKTRDGSVIVTATIAEGQNYLGATATYLLYVFATTHNYSYSGSAKNVTLPPGTYQFQCWGAQGASCSDGYSGGKGGYSVGQLSIANALAIQVLVGGQNGYNGGGSSRGSSSYRSGDTYGRSSMGNGGGATDIRLSNGALLSRMIVAGGGSGGAYCYKEVTTEEEVRTTFLSQSAESKILPSGMYYAGNGTPISVVAGKTYELSFTITSGTLDNTHGSGLEVYSSAGTQSGTRITVNGENASLYWRFRSGQAFTVSFTIEEIETTQSTTTDYDFQHGYDGGGINGVGCNSSYYGKQSAAGNGGSFGQGANQNISNYRYCSGAGGGGWYGGGGGKYSDSDMSTVSYSGGGSGWVNIAANASYRPSGYTGLELDGGKTISGDSSFPSTGGSTEYGHSGNGYARITRLDPALGVPLTFEVLEAGTIGWKCSNASYARTIEYRKNGGSWTSLTSTTSGATISVAAGDVIQFRGVNTYYGYTSYYNCFTATCRFKAYGNIMSLFDKTSFIGETTLTSNYALQYLFYNNTKLTDASGLFLPATTLTYYCYQHMFYGCTALASAPAILPATTLAIYCYQYMFYGCTSLGKAPVLPAISLTAYCYSYMFQNCSSLNYIKALFTTSPSSSCTNNWVSGVAASGTFVKHTNATWTATGVYACPAGWTVERASS